MNAPKKRSPFAIVRRLIVLVRPMLPVMLAAIAMGVAGYFCATFITIFGGFGLLAAAGLESPIPSVGTVFACILVFALLRGVLRYAEQASNHYIAFKLLALIRDRVFGALRRLSPAKLEGRDRGDLISLITADIEQLEVFYAHTISPVCIAVVCVVGMTCFTARYHLLPALVLLAGYLLVGAALPVWSARRGDKAARAYRQTLADTNSYMLENLRGLRDTLQYQDTANRAEGIAAHSEALGEKQKALKYREGVTVGATNTLILLTVLAVLGVSLHLEQSGALDASGVLVCTLAALSSFGPVVALANLGASLTQVFASADRVLDLLDEEPVTADVTDGADTAFAGAEARKVRFALPAAVAPLLGCFRRQHPLWCGGHPPREYRCAAGAGEPCDAGDGTVRRHHREQYQNCPARCHPCRGGSGLQKGGAGRFHPEAAQGLRYPGGRAGRCPLRRRAPAHRRGPRLPPRCTLPPAGRADLQPRQSE